MSEYLDIPVKNYGTIKIKVEPVSAPTHQPASGFEDVGLKEAKETVQKVTKGAVEVSANVFDDMMDMVFAMARGFQDKLDEIKEHTTIDEASLDFGLTVDTEANVYIFKVGGESNFNVSLKWQVTPTSNEWEQMDADRTRRNP